MLIFSLQNFSVHHMFWPLRPLPVCGMHRISGCRDLDTRRSLALFRGKYHQLYIAYKIITCFWSFQGLFTYLYVVSILFLLYVFCFLLHEYSCCGGPPAQPTVRNAYFHVSKACHTILTSHYTNTFLVQESWELHFAAIRCEKLDGKYIH